MSGRLIRQGRLVADAWQWLEADAPEAAARLAERTPCILPQSLWLAHRSQAEPATTALWLAPDDALDPVLPWLAELPLIAIRFPLFTDGRGYSLARLLRARHGYRGELRAVGDIQRDQLYGLQRCGFDAFELRADQALEEALAAFADYSWAPLTQG